MAKVWRSKMHLSNPFWRLRLLSVLRRWFFCCCLFVVLYTSRCLWGFCAGVCFVMHVFESFLVLQSSWQGRESWLLCFVFLVSRDCLCSVSLPHSAVDCLQCLIVVFPDHTHLLFMINDQASDWACVSVRVPQNYIPGSTSLSNLYGGYCQTHWVFYDTSLYNWAATWDFHQCGMCDQPKTQISLCIRAVWSEHLPIAWIFYKC